MQLPNSVCESSEILIEDEWLDLSVFYKITNAEN
jgi:hypothetical protein